MPSKMHKHKCYSEINRCPSQIIEQIEWIAIKAWAKEAKHKNKNDEDTEKNNAKPCKLIR